MPRYGEDTEGLHEYVPPIHANIRGAALVVLDRPLSLYHIPLPRNHRSLCLLYPRLPHPALSHPTTLPKSC
jgi:hypothetical protein